MLDMRRCQRCSNYPTSKMNEHGLPLLKPVKLKIIGKMAARGG